MNINIPNSVIWSNAYKVVLAIAFVIACFTSNPAYHIGSLFTISLMSVGVAYFIFKNKSEYALGLAKAIAALIPVFMAITYVVSDKVEKESMASIQESLSEQKNTYQKTLDGTYSAADLNSGAGKAVSLDEFKKLQGCQQQRSNA